MRLDPRNADGYLFEHGWAYNQLGRRKEAIPAFRRYLLSYPENLWAHALLADDYSLTGDGKGAQAETAAVERAIALNPDSAIGYAALAEVLNNQQKPAEALVAVEQAKRLDPRDSDNYLFQQSEAYTLLGQWTEAVTVLKRQLARYPDICWAHALLAVDYIELGHDDAARGEAAEAHSLNPQLSAEMVFPPDGLPQKYQPAWIGRLRGDLHKAGLN